MAATKAVMNGAVRIKGGDRRYVPGQEEELAKVATPEEIAHLTRMGAIEGFDTSVKEVSTSNLGATARTATKADTGALRTGKVNADALVTVSGGQSTTTVPEAGAESVEGDLPLEDMSRKQLLARADSLQVDMATVEGTGKDGYVTMEDLIRAIEAKQAEASST